MLLLLPFRSATLLNTYFLPFLVGGLWGGALANWMDGCLLNSSLSMAQICQVWLNGGSTLQFISGAKRSETERFLRLSSSFLIATQTMAALRANRSLMINQSKYALTPFTHSNKPKVGPRRTKWKMTEEGKTQAARCKAWLIECKLRVVRHPASWQRKKKKTKKRKIRLIGVSGWHWQEKKKNLSITLQLTPIQLIFSLHITQLSPATINTGLHFIGQGVNLFNYATDSSILL